MHENLAKELGVEVVGTHTGYYWEQMELPAYLRKMGSPKLINFCNMAPLSYGNNYIAMHDITAVRFPKTYSWAFRTAYGFMIPRLAKKAKHIFTVSEFSKKEIAGYYGMEERKITVTYNAVDNRFHCVEDKDMRREKYFIAVSSVKQNKNFPVVLQSFMEAKKTLKDARLYVVGDMKDKNFQTICLSAYGNEPSIKFLGRVSDEDLIRYYSNAIAFLFPSLYEGFGIPVLEAQACGCPVISSNAASMPEVLGDSALLCDPVDVGAFAKSMITLMSDAGKREKLIAMGHDNVKRFSWDESCRRIIEAVRNH